MRSLGNSLRKRFYSIMASPKKLKQEWGGKYWQDSDGMRDISCGHCRKFDKKLQQCAVPFGTPIRKCVVAAIEAHLHDAKGKNVLELGFGRVSLGKTLIQRSGGTWTGVEPHQPKNIQPKIGKGGYGHTEDIPFPDATFDMVYGIQTFEHWGQKAVGAAREPSDYGRCLDEIRRVLKPGGTIYLDAPIHLHGHEMFVMGDIPRIKALFPAGQWKNVIVERWRYNSDPLEKYLPTEKFIRDWDEEIESYDASEVEKIKNNPIWIFTITAEKIS